MHKQVFLQKNKSDSLLLFFSGYQLLLHVYFAFSSKDPRLLLPHLISYVQDLALLIIVYLVITILLKLASIKFKNFVLKFGLVLMFVTGLLLSTYPKLFREYLVFPVNIFDADISSTKTLMTQYLGLSFFIPVVIASVLAVFILLKKSSIQIPLKIKRIGFSLCILLFLLSLNRTSSQPFVFSVQQKIISLVKNEKKVVPSLSNSTTNQTLYNELKTLAYPNQDSFQYKRIAFIVLEGVTAKDFENEFLNIPNGFYQQYKQQAIYYNNYFTTNMDSYTSLIAMVTALQVPYRSYADVSLFDSVNYAPNLVNDFKLKGFSNLFISTYNHQPFVPVKNDWKNIYDLNNISNTEKFVSLGSSKMEAATEDKAALKTIVDFFKNNDKALVMHELVYGHSPEWRAVTGKTQLQYYNEYLVQLYEMMKQQNMADETLWVIVSDHGDRAKSFDAENYRVPLLIMGNQLKYSMNNQFLNHLQLPGIVYHYALSEPHPKENNEIYFVGSTEKWVYGKQTNTGDYIFINDLSGTILTQKGSIAPKQVYNSFQQYVLDFKKQFGKKED